MYGSQLLHLIFVWQNVVSFILLAVDFVVIAFLMCVCPTVAPVCPPRARALSLSPLQRVGLVSQVQGVHRGSVNAGALPRAAAGQVRGAVGRQ
jgi:hypothetical protein